MNILENELETIIEQMIKDKSDICENELDIVPGFCLRQPVIGGYGKIDLLNVSYAGRHSKNHSLRKWSVDILELKRDSIGFNELAQVCRYKTGLTSLLTKKFKNVCFPKIRLQENNVVTFP